MRRLVQISLVLVFSLALVVPAFAADSPAAKVTDLAWMTGHWEGSMGNGGSLEENWLVPEAGSIASLVRGKGNGATNMIEMIVIEEQDGSLVLRIQQWNPGYKPRTPGPQEMKLVEIGDRMVKFEAVSEGGLKTLGYSRPADDQFVISVSTAQGNFDIPLSGGHAE